MEQEAAKLFRRAAAQGNAEAQHNLGNMYANGWGVEQDEAEAATWDRLAAEQGISTAQLNLGAMHAFGAGLPQDSVAAYMWTALATASGPPEIQARCKELLDHLAADMTPEQVAQAKRSAAERTPREKTRPHVTATSETQSTPPPAYSNQADAVHPERNFIDVDAARDFQAHGNDYAGSVQEFLLSAEQGDAVAQGNLGFSYERGLGVPRDYAEAMRWYRLSAEQGDDVSQFSVGVMYDDGRGVTQDHAEAIRWYELAAAQGSTNAMYNLGMIYEAGRGVEEERDTATQWFDVPPSSVALRFRVRW